MTENDTDELIFRQAHADDVEAIVDLLADDTLGTSRERPGDPIYDAVFAEMDNDPNNELWVIEGTNGRVLGCLQLTVIPGLSRLGARRAMIESVRVHDDLRGKGVGRWLFEKAIERSRERDAQLVQLTSDKARPDAIRFYESLGFVASHEGMKLKI